MLKCRHGQQRFSLMAEGEIEKDAGDWVLPCLNCGAKNVLAPVVVDQVMMAGVEIIGWRE